MAEGSWTIIVYDHDCGKCARFMSRWEGAVATPSGVSGGADSARTALVDVGIVQAEARGKRFPGCFLGSLRSSAVWAGEVPTVLQLRDGLVVGIHLR
ncbi:MAG: hypothetical protein NTU53_09625 [Planctomycetota bacterium]|nr:hypothetical protein [Planctomycetota bacterium]